MKNYTGAPFRRDFGTGVNAMVMAFPLSVTFVIASRTRPEQGLITAIIGGGLTAALSGSPVPTGGRLPVWNHGRFKALLFFAAGNTAACRPVSFIRCRIWPRRRVGLLPGGGTMTN